MMTNKNKGIYLILQIRNYIILTCIILFSCTKKDYYIYNDGFIQGTTYHIIYENNNDLHSDIKDLLNKFDKSLSSYDSASIISRINRNEEDVAIDEYFKTTFETAQKVYYETHGAFDITIAPITNAWGFGFNNIPEKRDSLLISNLLQYIGMHKVTMINNRIQKKYPEIMLDVNAIAQGYSVDVVTEFLEERGIKNYLIEIGGEVKTKGVNKNERIWTVGIDKPIDNNNIPGQELQAKIQLKNKSLATSGNYRKFFEENGRKYSHTIDPRTGYPARNSLLSVTVITQDCIIADAYATAFMVMGLEKSKQFLLDHPELDVYFVYSNNKGEYETYLTENIKKRLIN